MMDAKPQYGVLFVFEWTPTCWVIALCLLPHAHAYPLQFKVRGSGGAPLQFESREAALACARVLKGPPGTALEIIEADPRLPPHPQILQELERERSRP